MTHISVRIFLDCWPHINIEHFFMIITPKMLPRTPIPLSLKQCFSPNYVIWRFYTAFPKNV